SLSYFYTITTFLIIVSYFYMYFFFFFNDTATTEIYTLSLHDALPISCSCSWKRDRRSNLRKLLKSWLRFFTNVRMEIFAAHAERDRKSTRLNSSHSQISYAVFCLKKKNKKIQTFSMKNIELEDADHYI